MDRIIHEKNKAGSINQSSHFRGNLSNLLDKNRRGTQIAVNISMAKATLNKYQLRLVVSSLTGSAVAIVNMMVAGPISEGARYRPAAFEIKMQSYIPLRVSFKNSWIQVKSSEACITDMPLTDHDVKVRASPESQAQVGTQFRSRSKRTRDLAMCRRNLWLAWLARGAIDFGISTRRVLYGLRARYCSLHGACIQIPLQTDFPIDNWSE